MATTKDVRPQWQLARRSGPISSSGIILRRLAKESATDDDEDDEDEEQDETKRPAECGNPFCRQVLANRYASFCEDKRMCQRYRALKLQCLANAQAEEDTRPLSLMVNKQRKQKDKSSSAKGTSLEVEASPRATAVSQRSNKGLKVSAAAAVALGSEEKRRSGVKSPRKNEKETTPRKKKKKKVEKIVESEDEEREDEEEDEDDDDDEEKKRRGKRVKRVREGQRTSVLVGRLRSSVQTPSGVDESGARADKLKKKMLSRVQLSTKTSGDGKMEIGSSSVRIKRRRLDGRLSTDTVASPRFVALSPKKAAASPSAASAADANWKIPRSTSSQERTSLQQIRRSMDVDLVPLGGGKSTKSVGGGRYVQNGIRAVSQVLRPANPRPRPLNISKLPGQPAVTPSSALPVKASPTFASTARQQLSPQHKPPLPSLPPQTSVSASPPVPHPPAKAVIPSPSSSAPPAVPAAIDSFATTATGPSEVSRISTLAYLKSKKGGCERQLPEQQTNLSPSRLSSPERFSNVSDDRALGISMAPGCPTGLPRYRNDSAPLTSFTESRFAADPRRHYFEVEAKHQRLPSENEENAIQYRERPNIGCDFERSASGNWKARNFPSPRERYSLRQQGAFVDSIRNNGFEYSTDSHARSAPSPVEQPGRGPQKEPSPPQHASPSCRGEQRVNNERRNSRHDGDEDDAPMFSYREAFLPHLLSIFIHQLPRALKAVYNVTKKPRKLIWYLQNIERIERICKASNLKVKINGLTAVVTVRGREWLTLQSTSTVALHLNVMKSLWSEATAWQLLYEEVESTLAYYKSVYGSKANESYSFLRAWNNLKNTGKHIPLSRETNYFCGARLHHWNFVVGKVEIGSGSHEEKREAFRLASISAFDFVLKIGRVMRHPTVERRRVPENDDDDGECYRSLSRVPSSNNRARLPYAEIENSISAVSSPSIGPSSPVELSAAAAQPSTEQLSMMRDDAESPSAEAPLMDRQPSPGEPSTEQLPTTRDGADRPPTDETTGGQAPAEQLPVTLDDAGRPPADASSIIQRPADDGSQLFAEVHSDTDPEFSCSHESAEPMGQCGPSEERDIRGDASDMSISPSAELPRISITSATSRDAQESTVTSAAELTPAAAVSSAPTAVISASTITLNPIYPTISIQSEPLAFIPAPTMAPYGASPARVGNMGYAVQRGIPALQAKATTPSRRCMMCEMIRMRKPDGERCLRCQQKDMPANAAFSAFLWP
uniref:Uncharacterized protein n=1 Tax=Hyaloperonospora arabidopsidis (strain Emoy2) TaxID=559515 RepID=M4BY54_HYAAE